MIGFFQAISIIPGVSRSGIVITACRYSNFNRVDAAKISFLLSIPILSATSFYGFLKIIEAKNLEITTQNFWAMILSFLFSFITLKFFLKFLKKFSLTFFMIYRVILGIIIFFLSYDYFFK